MDGPGWAGVGMMQATQEQLAALTVPATLPGVVRRGTPVLAHAVWFPPRAPGVVVRAGETNHLVGWDNESDWSEDSRMESNVDVWDLLVDLTDATGRAHVAWAVAAGRWVGPSDLTAAGRLGADCMKWDGPSIPFFRLHSADPRRGPVGRADWAPLVAHLDPTDETRLPDGSRLVDALALQAVALHVLGTGEVPAGPEESPGGAA